MTKLARCDAQFGNARLVAFEPDLRTHEAVFLPNTWGLFDHGRRLITSSAYWRGPHPDLVGCEIPATADWPAELAIADDADYFYLGPVHAHYGHFLLATFSRLWAFRKRSGSRPKLVTFALPGLAQHPYIPALLEAVGSSIDDCVTFSRPTLLPRVTVAAPSFEETNYVHADYQLLCGWTGDMLTGSGENERSGSGDPVYLAKFALSRGVAALDNEEALAERLERHGVEIVFPEQLSLARQVQLFRERSHFIGLVGSAFHTASFARGKRLTMINYSSRVFTNQLLIDRVCRHESLYLFPEAGIVERKRENFSVNYSLVDPAQTADQLARIFDRVSHRRGTARGIETDDPMPAELDGARNIARGHVALQSSTARVAVEGRERHAAEAALSGFLTGRPQTWTLAEHDPWWRVDLGREAELREIRVFEAWNAPQTDSAPVVTVDLSTDGATWMAAMRVDEGAPNRAQGSVGTDRRSTWRAPPTTGSARFVRVQIRGVAALTLDQVAVYGFFAS